MKASPRNLSPLNPINRLLFSTKLTSIVAVLSASLLALAYPPISFSLVAFIAFVPLLFITTRRQDRGLFWQGSLFGLIYFFFSFIWLASVKPLSYLNPLLVASVWAPLVGLWLYWTRKFYWRLVYRDPVQPILTQQEQSYLIKPLPAILYLFASSGLWCSLESIRFWLFTGFPWNTLAVSQINHPFVTKIVPFTGMLGVSFVVIFSNLSLALVAETLYQRKKIICDNLLPSKTVTVVLSALTVIWFAIFLCPSAGKIDGAEKHRLKVAVLQGGFIPDLAHLPSEKEVCDFVDFYYENSLEAAKEKPDLIIWPETGIPAPFRYKKYYSDHVQKLVKQTGIPLLLGSSDYRPGEGQRMDAFNSAFYIDRRASIKNTYDKIHLVPYGEYTPFKGLIPDNWHKALNQFSGMGPGLQQGKSYTVFNHDEKVKFGVNICFEDVFPEISRAFAARGANLLMTLTNDAWFLQTSGGEQHTNHAAFRALETGLPLLRCGNWSESCLVKPDGTISQLMVGEDGSRFSRGWRIINVEMALEPEPTFYQKHPFVFTVFHWLLAFLMFCYLLRLFYQKKSGLYKAMKGDS